MQVHDFPDSIKHPTHQDTRPNIPEKHQSKGMPLSAFLFQTGAGTGKGLWYIAPMRLVFVADGRSPTTLSWLTHWIESGYETHLISTFPSIPSHGLASFHILPVAFGRLAGGKSIGVPGSLSISGSMGRHRNLLRRLRYVLGPLSLPSQKTRFQALIKDIHPDIVHALRIPFEGMLASATPMGVPLVVSIWGNDITLHASGSVLMAQHTRRTLRRADGLIADTIRDIRLGKEWGFANDEYTLVVPGAGGIRLDEIEASSSQGILPEELPAVPIVVNPRGQRPGSLRQDVFFQSIPLVLGKIPNTLFVCPQLAGDEEANHWVNKLGIGPNTKLWPRLEQAQMWKLYKKAQVFASPSIHDGTPNSLLEAMACGCFPVVGDIESMQDWVKQGINGLLVDATSPRAMADGIITALENQTLRENARKENIRIIAERAEYRRCMAMTDSFYQKISRGNL